MAHRVLLLLLVMTGLVAAASGIMLLSSEPSEPAPQRAGASPPPGAVDARALERRDPALPSPGLEGVRLGEFALVDQDAEPVDESILQGGVTIVDFVFSNCPVICPAMTATMERVQDRLEGVEGIRFVSFSLDVERDTPRRLREWAAQHNADLRNWTFVTGRRPGDQAQIDRLAEAIPGFEIGRDPSRLIPLKTGEGTMPNVSHPPHLLLLGPARQVLGLYPYSMPTEIDRLVERARVLAGGGGPGGPARSRGE